MDTLVSRTATAACLALFMAAAHAQGTVALAGQVSSAEEGPMEGVVVSAKKDGSTISVSVVTDAQGRFAFPGARLDPGHYTLKARGHEVSKIKPLSISSCATAVLIDPASGNRIAGADPRRDCYAMAY